MECRKGRRRKNFSHEHVFDKCCLSSVPMQPDAHCHRDIASSRVPAIVINAPEFGKSFNAPEFGKSFSRRREKPSFVVQHCRRRRRDYSQSAVFFFFLYAELYA